jgi:hypothetical protein
MTNIEDNTDDAAQIVALSSEGACASGVSGTERRSYRCETAAHLASPATVADRRSRRR